MTRQVLVGTVAFAVVGSVRLDDCVAMAIASAPRMTMDQRVAVSHLLRSRALPEHGDAEVRASA